jgi:tetratricopeptide (TPR) repeat protein
LTVRDTSQRLTLLEGYLRQDPANEALREELVDLLMHSGKLFDARHHVDDALRLAPDHKPMRYRRAVIDHHSGRLSEAHDELKQLIAEGETAQAIRLELAKVQADLGELEACAETLRSLSNEALAAGIATNVAFLHVRTLHRLGRIDDAIRIAEDFLQLQGDVPPLTSALATLYLDANRIEDATRLCREVEAIRPLDAELLAVDGFVELNAADVERAASRFEESLARSPGSGRALLGLGLAHATSGRLDQAKQALAAATRAMPTHLGTWHALAWMHLLDKELDQAGQAFAQALAADRNFGDSHGGLAIVAALSGERAKAEELIRTGHRLDPQSLNVGTAMTVLRYGGSMDSKEFVDSAMKMLETRALSRNPAMQMALNRLLSSRSRSVR